MDDKLPGAKELSSNCGKAYLPRSAQRLTNFADGKAQMSVCVNRGKELEALDLAASAIRSSFVYGQCLSTYCKSMELDKAQDVKVAGSVLAALVGNTDYASTECSARRSGLLCGKCSNGFALTPYYMVSIKRHTFVS